MRTKFIFTIIFNVTFLFSNGQNFNDQEDFFKEVNSFTIKSLSNICELKNSPDDYVYKNFFKIFNKNRGYSWHPYIIPVDPCEFDAINEKLKDRYCYFFPIVTIEYQKATKKVTSRPHVESGYVSSNFNDSISGYHCDTLKRKAFNIKRGTINFYSPGVIRLSDNFIEYLKGKYAFNNDSFVATMILKLYEDMGQLDLPLFINFILDYKDDRSFNLTKDDKDLLGIVFWNYISYCANYNLYKREYKFHETQ